MALKNLFAAVILAAALTSAWAQLLLRGKTRLDLPGLFDFRVQNVSEFVGTSEPIWTYRSNTQSNVRCKVDVMQSISQKSILFNRTQYYNEHRTSTVLEGTFDPKMQDTLFLGGPGQTKHLIEQMNYMSGDRSCAVFMRRLTNMVIGTYDLRVRNSSITAGPKKECVDLYESMFRGQDKLLYTDDCQKILLKDSSR